MNEERRYEVLGVLGQGGFGTVYRARFLGEGGFAKEVALKMLNDDMAGVEEVARRLRDEARVLGLVRHRAIVAVDRLTQIDGRWTVVMEYVEGQDLGQLLRAGPVPASAALEITAEIAGALNAAWARPGPDGRPLSLLHRDLKPSNIRITPYGEIKILDFGIARAEFGSREAKTRSLAFGTPEYMSPERLDFSADTAAGDIYALGAVLFELLVAIPFGRSSANPAKHARKIQAAIAAMQRAQVPGPAQELLVQMMQFDEAARPSAAEVERGALALARRGGGLGLREWVDSVSELMALSVSQPEGITGSILVERAEAAPEGDETRWQRSLPPAGRPPTPQPTPLTPAVTAANPAETLLAVVTADADRRAPTVRSSALAWGALGLAVLLLVGMGAAGLALWSLKGAVEAPKAPSAGALVEASVVEPGPADERPAGASDANVEQRSPVSQEGVPEPGEVERDAPKKAEASVAQARKTASPAPAPPKRVAVGLTGDAKQAWLRDAAGGTYALPDDVPAGDYAIYAIFERDVEAKVGEVSVREGEPMKIHCDFTFGKCAGPRGAP